MSSQQEVPPRYVRDETALTGGGRSKVGQELIDCIDGLTTTVDGQPTGIFATAPHRDIVSWLAVVYTAGTSRWFRLRLAWRILRGSW